MAKGGGGTSTTNTVAQLPAYAQPYAEELMKRGSELSNQPYEAYTGQRSADFTDEQNAALGLTTNRALNGNASMNAGNQNLTDTINGNYLDVTQQPGFAQGLADITKAYSTGTAASRDASFNRSGAYGGSAYDEMKGMDNRVFADALNKFAGDQYQAERGRQMNAMQLAPQYAANDMQDLAALGSVGDIRQDYNQSLLDENYGNWFAEQQQPYKNLDVLSAALAGSVGNAGTTSSTATSGAAKGSKIGGVLGGAAMGAATGNPFLALGGGLLGLFG